MTAFEPLLLAASLRCSRERRRERVSGSRGLCAACADELVKAHRTGKLVGSRDAVSGRLLGILPALIGTAEAAQVVLDLAARESLQKTYLHPVVARSGQPALAAEGGRG
ncbi:MAG: hypothetical protein ABSC94_33535 [Polyangiaceae bacterium]|jgi:hypothetical protein